MRARAFLLPALCLCLVPAMAQEEELDYVRPLTDFSVGMDIFGPMIALLPQDEQRLRMEFVFEQWYTEKRGWRISYSHVDERYPADVQPLELLNGLFLERTNTERYTTHMVRTGLQAQHRHPRISGRIGVAMQVGTERSRLTQDVQRYLPDTLPCQPCNLYALDEQLGLLVDDRLLLLGMETTVGMSGRIGNHWEVEFRFPLQVRWRMLLSRREDAGMGIPQGWDDRVRFGPGFPGLFVHYRW